MGSSSIWRDFIRFLTSGPSRATFLLRSPFLRLPGNAQTLKAVKERAC